MSNTYKRIKLSKDKFAIVDDLDFEQLSQYSWCASNSGKDMFYAHRKCNGKTILMHRFIMGVKDKNIEVDHKNHNTLDNRRCNLRICSRSENNKNKTSHKGATSKYVGVSFDKSRNKWKANICINRKHIYLGRFQREEDAALAYDDRAKVEFKEYANVNFKI